MTITVERNQKIQSLYIYIHTHTQQKNIKERRVTIKRIVQMLKLFKD